MLAGTIVTIELIWLWLYTLTLTGTIATIELYMALALDALPNPLKAFLSLQHALIETVYTFSRSVYNYHFPQCMQPVGINLS